MIQEIINEVYDVKEDCHKHNCGCDYHFHSDIVNFTDNDELNFRISQQTPIVEEKKFVRNCPDCGKEIVYKTKQKFKKAIKNSSKCKYCCNLKFKNQDIYKRNCPDCGKELSYKNKSSYSLAIKKNSKCINCCNLKYKKQEIYKRNCPVCNKEMVYKSKTGFINGIKNNCVCYSCAKTIHDKNKIYKRNCPDCNKEMVYNNIYVFRVAEKRNTKCKDCCYKSCNITEYFRNCSICNKIVYYNSNYRLQRATKRNSKCYFCAHFTHEKQEEYSKNCPKCGKKMVYKKYSDLNDSIKKNRLCRNCANRKYEKHEEKEFYYRNCPKCNKIMTHKNYNTYRYSERDKKLCKNCKNLKYEKNKIYIRICPVCNKETKYTNVNSFLQANKRKSMCEECKFIYLNKLAKKKNLTLNIFIEKSIKIHDLKYDYSKGIYINNRTKIEIICPIHGSFWQKPTDHMNGANCQKCYKSVSKGELEFLNYLKIPDNKECRQKYIKPYRVDGIIKNVIYEYLGDIWHGNLEVKNSDDVNFSSKLTFRELYNKTFERFNKLKEMGYTIKYIWENDWKRFVKGYDLRPDIRTF